MSKENEEDYINDAEENPTKKQKVDAGEPEGAEDVEDGSEGSEETVCIVCMEPDCSDRPLLDEHQCSQCNKDAWKICACCNDSILSRTCPVCRGNYAPILLHVVPGTPLNQLADTSLTADAKALLLYKFGIVRRLISKSNVAVYNPGKEQMHFSLPREFAGDTTDVNCLTVTIAMKPDRIVNGTFTFDNTVWDEIEHEVEHGTDPTGEMRLAKDAVQWLLSFTRHEDHQILSMVSTEDWENMLDPAKSADTAEALQSIKVGLTAAAADST
jgi:hypothetical protein